MCCVVCRMNVFNSVADCVTGACIIAFTPTCFPSFTCCQFSKQKPEYWYTQSAWKSALLTPIPKVTTVKSFTDLLIVRKDIIPALPLESISDQFAYRPTGSTMAALVSLTHTVAQKLESCSHVRCLFIDYTKAFDTINHSILFRKFLSLSIPSYIQR